MKLGKLTSISGPMFSGKTSKLVAMVEVFSAMGYKVLTVKPELDNRYGEQEEIRSHDNKSATALLIKSSETAPQMLQKITANQPNKVIFDEIQFFDKEVVLDVISKLRNQGVDVVVAGLLYDYRRQPFGPTAELMSMADESLELQSICQKCGSLAKHSERTQGSKKQIDVGEADKYIAVCDNCHLIFAE